MAGRKFRRAERRAAVVEAEPAMRFAPERPGKTRLGLDEKPGERIDLVLAVPAACDEADAFGDEWHDEQPEARE